MLEKKAHPSPAIMDSVYLFTRTERKKKKKISHSQRLFLSLSPFSLSSSNKMKKINIILTLVPQKYKSYSLKKSDDEFDDSF